MKLTYCYIQCYYLILKAKNYLKLGFSLFGQTVSPRRSDWRTCKKKRERKMLNKNNNYLCNQTEYNIEEII